LFVELADFKLAAEEYLLRDRNSLENNEKTNDLTDVQGDSIILELIRLSVEIISHCYSGSENF